MCTCGSGVIIKKTLRDVCSNANPLHYYALQVPRKAWIDGDKCGLFLNHTPLGQSTLCVGRVSV